MARDAKGLPVARHAGTSDGAAELAAGLGLGAGLLATAVVTMRPLLLGAEDPSAANALVLSVAVLLAGTVLARGVAETSLRLPPLGVSVSLAALLALGFLSVFAGNAWPAELALHGWFAHALVFLAVYGLVARTAPASDGAGRGVVAAVLAAAAVVMLFGIYQRVAVLPHLLAGIEGTLFQEQVQSIPGAMGRVTAREVFATFFLPNAFAGYVVLLLPVAVGCALAARAAHELAAGLAAWALAALLAVGLVLSGSLGGMIAAPIGLVAAGAFLWGRQALALARRCLPAGQAGLPESRATRRLATGALAAAALVVLIAAAWAVSGHLSMRVRTEYWRAGVSMLADNPAGVGLGNFGIEYPRYKTPAGWETRDPHNGYLAIAVEAGPAALVALGVLLWAFWRHALAAGGESVGEVAPEANAAPGPPAGAQVKRRARLLALVGGLSGMAASYVGGLAMYSGSVSEMFSRAADRETVWAGLIHAGFFGVWAGLFWLLHRVDPASPAVRAGILGGIVAILVHSTMDMDLGVKGIALTAAALGAVALADSRPLVVPLRGGRGFVGSTAAAGLLALLLWRGAHRPLLLWGHAAVTDREIEAFAGLERARGQIEVAFSTQTANRDGIRKTLASLDGPAFAEPVAGARRAMESGDEPELRRACATLARRLDDEATQSLRNAWKFGVAYVEMAPGDIARVIRLADTGERLARREGGEKSLARTESALRRLTELSPDSHLAWERLAEFMAARGALSQAESMYAKAAERYPLRPGLWILLGDVSGQIDCQRARAAYGRALDVNRVVADERTTLFARFWTMVIRRPPHAGLERAFEEAERELGPTPEIAFRRGLMLAEIGGFAEAAAAFEKASTLARESRSRDVPQLAAFRALALEMESARAQAAFEALAPDAEASGTRTEQAAAAAKAAWASFRELQGRAPADGRVPDAVGGLFPSRLREVREVARGGRRTR